jgi:hypothetical protein
MAGLYHACRWPSDPIQTAVINTAASLRWKDAVVAGELTQPFAGWGGKPLKRLAVGGLAHHWAKAIVSMRGQVELGAVLVGALADSASTAT